MTGEERTAGKGGIRSINEYELTAREMLVGDDQGGGQRRGGVLNLCMAVVV